MVRKPLRVSMNGGVSGSITLSIFTGILMYPAMQGKNWWLGFVFISGKWSFLIPSTSPFPSSSHIACQVLAFRPLGNALTAAGKGSAASRASARLQTPLPRSCSAGCSPALQSQTGSSLVRHYPHPSHLLILGNVSNKHHDFISWWHGPLSRTFAFLCEYSRCVNL